MRRGGLYNAFLTADLASEKSCNILNESQRAAEGTKNSASEKSGEDPEDRRNGTGSKGGEKLNSCRLCPYGADAGKTGGDGKKHQRRNNDPEDS